MSSSGKPSSSKPGTSSSKAGVGSRKAHHALSQQKLDGFFSPSPLPARSTTPSTSTRKVGQPSKRPSSLTRKASSTASSTIGDAKRTAVSAFQDKDRAGPARPSSSTPSATRSSAGPSSIPSGSKLIAASSEAKRRRATSSVGLENASGKGKGKGKAREIFALDDDAMDGRVKMEDNSDISEDEPIPVRKRRKLSALPRPGGRPDAPRRDRSSSSPTSSPPAPQRSAIAALPPERNKSRSKSRAPAPPPPALHLSSSPPQDPDPPLPRRPVRSHLQSSPPPELSASLAPYLPIDHPYPTQLYQPKDAQARADAIALTGLRDSEEDHLRWLRKDRFLYDTDASYAERKKELRELEAKREQDRINNSMRPPARDGWQTGGPRDVERQRLAREADKDRLAQAKTKDAERARSRELSGKRSIGLDESDSRRPTSTKVARRTEGGLIPRIHPASGLTSAHDDRQPTPDNQTPTPSSSRARPLLGSRPRHNPSSRPRPSTSPVIVKLDRDPTPPLPRTSSLRRALFSAPVVNDDGSLTESQFEPLPDRAAPAEPSLPPSPPTKVAQLPTRPLDLQRPPSDDAGEPSQWSMVDQYHPDLPANPFINHPIPLSDILPVNPTIAGMGVPDPDEYETQVADGLAESQWGISASSAAGWSAFEAAHVYRPGGVFEDDPSRLVQVEKAAREQKSVNMTGPPGVGVQQLLRVVSSQTQPSSSSQTQDENSDHPGSPSVHSSRVLVAGTPSPKTSPARSRKADHQSSPIKTVLIAQHKQHVLLRQGAPSSPSSGPSSEDSVAYVGLSPGSIPVRPFVVAKDDSSSGPDSAGALEPLAADLTPKAKEARRWMQNEVDPADGAKSEKAFRGDSAKKKLVDILSRAGSSRSTSSHSGSGGSPTKPLMGPPAPPTSTSPRKGPRSPTKAPRSPVKGSPLRPGPALSVLPPPGGPLHMSESEDDDDDDDLVPDSQSQLLQPRLLMAKPNKPVFRPVLSPIPASGSVAPTASSTTAVAGPTSSAGKPKPKPKPKPKVVPFGIINSFAGLAHAPDDDTYPAAGPFSSAKSFKPPAPVLSATKLEEFGFTRRRERKPLDRSSKPGDELLEDVSASEDEDHASPRPPPLSARKSEEKEREAKMEMNSPSGGSEGRSLGRVPSPPPLHALKPTVNRLRRRTAARRSSGDLEVGISSAASSSRPAGDANAEADDPSDTDSVVISSQTQQLVPPRPLPPPRRKSSILQRRPRPSIVYEEDDEPIVPSSQATQDLLPRHSPYRPDPERDAGYETDDEQIIRSSQKEEWSPISFSARERAEREGKRVYFHPSQVQLEHATSPRVRGDREADEGEEEEEEDGDRTITGPIAYLPEPSSSADVNGGGLQRTSSSSSGGGLSTPLRQMEEARERLRLALASSSSSSGDERLERGVGEEREAGKSSSSLTSLSDL